jgi:ligand-binding SRPBCC domain-containing protein
MDVFFIMPKQFSQQMVLPSSTERAFAYLAHPNAFWRLTPPWEPVRLVMKTGGITDGSILAMDVNMAPGIWVRWVAEHSGYVEGQQFIDTQTQGPFALWQHTHRLQPHGNESNNVNAPECLLTDDIKYALPFGWATGWLGYPMVVQKINRMFAYRHHIMALDLSLPPLPEGYHRVWIDPQIKGAKQLERLLGMHPVTLCQHSNDDPNVMITPVKPKQYGASVIHLSPQQSPQLPEAFGMQLSQPNCRQGLFSEWSRDVDAYRLYYGVLAALGVAIH